MKTESIDVKLLNDPMKNKEKCLQEIDGPHFYKILLKDLNNKNIRRIPKDFSKVMGTRFPCVICLMPPWGQKSRVVVDLEGEDMVMVEGWKGFLKENEIKEEQFLVFRHNGEKNFSVQIFSPSGLEIICEPKKVQGREEAGTCSSSTNGKRKRGRPRKNAQTKSINCPPGKDMERNLSTNKIPAFFRPFVVEDREQRLKIPFAFSTYMEGKMPSSAFLRDRSGSRWLVAIVVRDQLVCFEGGWTKFVEKNNVQFGDFLIFQYDGKFNFDIKVLGLNACEKNAIVRARDVEVKETDKKEERKQKKEDLVEVDHYVVEEGDEDLREEEEEEEAEDDYEYKDDKNDKDYVVSDDDDGASDDDYVISDDDCVGDDESHVGYECNVVNADADDNTSDEEEGLDLDEEPMRKNGSAAACMLPTGRRSHDSVLEEENKIFATGKVERPKVNAYFVAKINPFRPSDLYVPIDLIKDFKLKLADSIIIRDEEGRVWTLKVHVWKDGRTWLASGWKAFCRWNKVKPGDMCFCEFVPQDDGENHILQITVVRV